MTGGPMTPEEFGRALDRLIAGVKTLVVLPLDDMTQYVESVESRGDDAANQSLWTDELQETARIAARLIAAAHHVRSTAGIGGES